MARIDLRADWKAFSSGNQASIVVEKGDLEADKREAVKQAQAAIDGAEERLDRPEVARATLPVARAAQANTPASPAPKPQPKREKK